MQIRLKNDELICKHCGCRLHSKGLQKRTIKRLNSKTGRIETTTISYQRAWCVNEKCKYYHKIIRPSSIDASVLGKMQYTIDTMAKIVHLHGVEKLTFMAIKNQMGLPTSSAHNLYHHGCILQYCITACSHSSNGTTQRAIEVIRDNNAVIAIRIPNCWRHTPGAPPRGGGNPPGCS